MQLKKEYIEKIKKYFISKPVIKAYLFGSFSRGEADESSDIDILVELDYTKNIGLEFFRMQNELQNILHRKVDLLTTKAVSKYIHPFIDKDKSLIYEK